MKRNVYRFLVIVALLVAAPSIARADLYSYSDQGVQFDLNVTQNFGQVLATLQVTADNTGDQMKAVSVKLFSSPPAGGSPIVSGPDDFEFLSGGWGGGGPQGVGANNPGANSGFVSAVHGPSIGTTDLGGILMDGSTYNFLFQWDTLDTPLLTPSIKAWTSHTALSTNKSRKIGTKSRQWSSGELALAPVVPEPATFAMFGLGFAGVASMGNRRRRRR